MAQPGESLISITEAAAAEGIARQTLWRQTRKGQVRRHGDKVYLSEVRADRRANLDPTHRIIHAERKRKAARAAAAAPEPMVKLAEVVAWLAAQTATAIAATGTASAVIDLPHLDATVTRPAANELLGAYRRGASKANLRTIRALHRRVGAPAGD